MQRDIDRLVAQGEINPNRIFRTPDDAAKSILNVVAPVAHRYGLEVGGSIYPEKVGVSNQTIYKYTIPVVGTDRDVSIARGFIGYHTHPNGSILFSNPSLYGIGRGDTEIVRTSRHALYVGSVLDGGSVGIAVCEPSSCRYAGEQAGTPGRVVQ